MGFYCLFVSFFFRLIEFEDFYLARDFSDFWSGLVRLVNINLGFCLIDLI